MINKSGCHYDISDFAVACTVLNFRPYYNGLVAKLRSSIICMSVAWVIASAQIFQFVMLIHLYNCMFLPNFILSKMKEENTLLARFLGPHVAYLGPTGPRWAPCGPREPCYLVSTKFMHLQNSMTSLWLLYTIGWFINYAQVHEMVNINDIIQLSDSHLLTASK